MHSISLIKPCLNLLCLALIFLFLLSQFWRYNSLKKHLCSMIRIGTRFVLCLDVTLRMIMVSELASKLYKSCEFSSSNRRRFDSTKTRRSSFVKSSSYVMHLMLLKAIMRNIWNGWSALRKFTVNSWSQTLTLMRFARRKFSIGSETSGNVDTGLPKLSEI